MITASIEIISIIISIIIITIIMIILLDYYEITSLYVYQMIIVSYRCVVVYHYDDII